MITGNGAKNNVIKGPIPGNVTLIQDEFYLIKEQAFTQSQRFTFDSDETMWFLVDASAYVPGPTQELNKVIARVPRFFTEAGPIHIDFYRAPTLGTAVATPLTVPPFNRVAGSAISAQLVISSLDKAPDSLGTLFSQLLVPGSGVGVGNQIGGELTETLPLIFDIPTPVLIAVTNTDGAGVGVVVRHDWFEI